MTWERVKDGVQSGRDSFGRGVEGFVEGVENWTGLKVKDTFNAGKEVVEVETKEVVKAVEAKVEEVKGVAEKKVEEAKRLV